MSHGFEMFLINRSGWFKRCRYIFERFWNSSIVCANDVDTGLNDFGTADVV
jgi:hypothetical protein